VLLVAQTDTPGFVVSCPRRRLGMVDVSFW
jgi:hypothetical protein